jgi:hypothetical protein
MPLDLEGAFEPADESSTWRVRLCRDTPIAARLVTTEEDRLAAYRSRYEAHVEEQAESDPEADQINQFSMEVLVN